MFFVRASGSSQGPLIPQGTVVVGDGHSPRHVVMTLEEVQEGASIQVYKASQGLGLGLAYHHCRLIPLTEQSLQWEGLKVTGQRACWAQHRGEEWGTIAPSGTQVD